MGKDTMNQDVDKGAAKFDAGKIRMDLVPKDAVLAVASVLTFGAKKYDPWNWARKGGLDKNRLIASLERHMAALQQDEYLDEESGRPHLWHVGCVSLMLISLDARNSDTHPSLNEKRTALDSILLTHELAEKIELVKPPKTVL